MEVTLDHPKHLKGLQAGHNRPFYRMKSQMKLWSHPKKALSDSDEDAERYYCFRGQ